MNINVTIALTPADADPVAKLGSAEDLAAQILALAGGDPSKDVCAVSVSGTVYAGAVTQPEDVLAPTPGPTPREPKPK